MTFVFEWWTSWIYTGWGITKIKSYWTVAILVQNYLVALTNDNNKSCKQDIWAVPSKWYKG